MLIGLNGKAGSGKDTVFQRAVIAAAILGIPTPKRIAFADPLKNSVAALLGITRDQIETAKSDSGSGHLTILGKPMSMRTFLQRYGTESHRDVFGSDFWVDASLPLGFNHANSIVFVTDVRFQNEVDRIRFLGGKIIKVSGPDDVIAESASGHVSEHLDVNADFTIDNSDRTSFNSLDRQVVSLLSSWLPGEMGVAEVGERGVAGAGL